MKLQNSDMAHICSPSTGGVGNQIPEITGQAAYPMNSKLNERPRLTKQTSNCEL